MLKRKTNMRIRFTGHSYLRFLERIKFDGNRKQADSFLKNAMRRGRGLDDLTKEELTKLYQMRILSKKKVIDDLKFRKIRIYKDGIYFFGMTNSCITVIPNPLQEIEKDVDKE